MEKIKVGSKVQTFSGTTGKVVGIFEDESWNEDDDGNEYSDIVTYYQILLKNGQIESYEEDDIILIKEEKRKYFYYGGI